MDALSEILRGVVLKGALYFNAEFSAPWGFRTPATAELAQLLTPGAPHLMIYHLLIEARDFFASRMTGNCVESGRCSRRDTWRSSRNV